MPERVFSLGRECTLEIDGQVIDGVADVTVRERTDTVDATGFGHTIASEVPVVRSYSLAVAFREIKVARELWLARHSSSSGFELPKVFTIAVEGGVMEFYRDFILADIDEDQPVDSNVAAVIRFNQWGHA